MCSKTDQTFVYFGGTFSPVHLGHIGLVEGLLQQKGVSKVVVVPTAQNPFKNQEGLLPAKLRLEMVEKVFAGMERVEVSDIELCGPQPSFTVNSLEAVQAVYPLGTWRLAIGWDVFQQFHAWHKAERILDMAGLWIVRRAGSSPEELNPEDLIRMLPESSRDALTIKAGRVVRLKDDAEVVRVMDLELPEISSSEIREGEGLEQVPESVRDMLEVYWRNHKMVGEV